MTYYSRPTGRVSTRLRIWHPPEAAATKSAATEYHTANTAASGNCACSAARWTSEGSSQPSTLALRRPASVWRGGFRSGLARGRKDCFRSRKEGSGDSVRFFVCFCLYSDLRLNMALSGGKWKVALRVYYLSNSYGLFLLEMEMESVNLTFPSSLPKVRVMY